MADDKRFVKTYSQGFWDRTMEIWVDRKTGVNYLVTAAGYNGGMTVLLDAYGKPVITPIRDEE